MGLYGDRMRTTTADQIAGTFSVIPHVLMYIEMDDLVHQEIAQNVCIPDLPRLFRLKDYYDLTLRHVGCNSAE